MRIVQYSVNAICCHTITLPTDLVTRNDTFLTSMMSVSQKPVDELTMKYDYIYYFPTQLDSCTPITLQEINTQDNTHISLRENIKYLKNMTEENV